MSELKRTDWREYLARPYVFWTPHEWFATSVEYQYEQFLNGSQTSVSYLKESRPHNNALSGLDFFHPSGSTFGTEGNLLQSAWRLSNAPLSVACCESGRSDFWVVDAGRGHRLPKRHGFFTVGATNLFDRKFKYQETDLNNRTIQPDRTFFARLQRWRFN